LPEFMDYREQTRTLAGVAAYANWSASMAGEGVTERFQGARVSANAFDVLGVSPAAGRLLSEADDRAEASQVAVVSYRLWQRQFGGARDAIGKSVRINGESFEIVGVLPAQFLLPLRDIDVIVPLVPGPRSVASRPELGQLPQALWSFESWSDLGAGATRVNDYLRLSASTIPIGVRTKRRRAHASAAGGAHRRLSAGAVSPFGVGRRCPQRGAGKPAESHPGSSQRAAD
jgi:hypothetical protein